MAIRNEPVEELENRIRRRERRILLRSIVLTAVPILAGGVLLWSTVGKVRDAERQLETMNTQLSRARAERDAAQAEAQRLRREVRGLRREVRTLKRALRVSTDFARNRYTVGFGQVKLISSESLGAARLLSTLLQERGARWGFFATPPVKSSSWE